MNIEICSIKMLKYKLQNEIKDIDNCYCIISTSYVDSIEFLDEFDFNNNILIEYYDDVKSFNNNSFSEKIAQEIKDFIDDLPNNCKLYICCDEGVSRSSAIACAVMRYIGQDEMKIWKDPHYHPNIFVYSILCNIMGYDDTNKRLQQLQKISDNSLTNIINKSR